MDDKEQLEKKFSDEVKTVCQIALETYGLDAQLDRAIEELAELIHAIIRVRRGKDNPELLAKNIREEIADVLLMCQQLMLIFGGVHKEQKLKLERLKKQLKKAGRKIP